MVLFFLACTSSSSDTAIDDLQGGELQILSYNIHGLPSVVTGDDTPARIRTLSPLLNAFPLVALQEDWEEDNHQLILEHTNHPYDDYFDEKISPEKQYGSGLSFLSDRAFLSVEHVHYTDCNGLLDGASDCFASKGFQRLELSLNRQYSIHIYNTHLEAGGGPEDNRAREAQVMQLLDTFENQSSDIPILFLGDMNLHADDPNDAPLLEHFAEAGFQESCALVSCPEPNWIDKIFIRSSASVVLDVQSWSHETQFVDEEGMDLSDHPAVSSSIVWTIQ